MYDDDESEAARKFLREMKLSPRECDVVLGVTLQDLTNREIGENLGLSKRTIETHREHALRKLGIHGTVDLCKFVFIGIAPK
ncbi:MAG: LuxR C-terminal-related transcriptional regulator [Candidatus Pacebacteria bacterium]|nr:LuxR C-terminal-related transcriptional regulator [Candidatus Paceibacterota bacterium]